jgi:hypothetical protein
MSLLVRRSSGNRRLRTQHLRPAQSRDEKRQQRKPPRAKEPERKLRIELEVSAHENGSCHGIPLPLYVLD